MDNEGKAARPVPVHIGIIMDGNGRWAKKRGMPRSFGHRRGAAVFEEIAEYCNSIGVKYLTVYAFSTENWSRPGDEVSALMGLFREYILSRAEKPGNIRVKVIGDLSGLDPELQRLVRSMEEKTGGRDGLTAVLAINYGGRDEILHAASRKGGRWQHIAGRDRRGRFRVGTVHGGHAGSRFHPAPERGEAPLELPAVAGFLQRVHILGRSVARFHPRAARGSDR